MAVSAIHELLDLSERIREMILDRRPASEIKRAGARRGYDFSARIGHRQSRLGMTTLKEINKVTFIEG
jgi:type IV pilus assembly protein PilB